MQIVFGGGILNGLESIIYSSVIFSGTLHISRVKVSDGAIHWTYGFPCGSYQENVFITYRQNVSPAENMLLATCLNTNNFIRYGILRISDVETTAAAGPILTSFQLFDDV
jgi:hypothetical protein